MRMIPDHTIMFNGAMRVEYDVVADRRPRIDDRAGHNAYAAAEAGGARHDCPSMDSANHVES
jgi:hypothetical protein